MVDELLYTLKKVVIRQVLKAKTFELGLDKLFVDVFYMMERFFIEYAIRMVTYRHA